MPPFCCSLATATPATHCGTLRRQGRPRRPNRTMPSQTSPRRPNRALPGQTAPRRPNRALLCLVRPRLPGRAQSGKAGSRHACLAIPCLPSHANEAMPAVPLLVWQLHTSPRLPSRSRYCRSPPSGPCLRSLVIRYRVPHRHTMPATPWGAIPCLPYLPVQTEPSPTIAASPAAPFLSVPTKPCRPCHPVHWAQALPTVPCLPCPIRPTLPSLPTHANSVLSPTRHACAAALCIARPRLARRANGFHPRPRLAGHNWPGRALQNHAGHSGPT